MHEIWSKQHGLAMSAVIVILAILGIAGYAASQLFPLYYAHWDLEQGIQTTLMGALTPPYTDVVPKVTQAVTQMLDKLGAQYAKEQVKVELSSDNKTIQVEVWYARPHHLPFYPNPKRFYVKVTHTALLPISPKTVEIPTRPPLKEE
jgi:hypothetical protein